MVRRWHANPFGFLPMGRGARAHGERATRHALSTGTGVVAFLMG